MTKDETYNGWTNRETWVVNLWLTNEPRSNDALLEIVTTETETVSDRADMLKDFVEEAFDLPTEGLAADLCGIGRVNWHEIIRAHEED